jgi:hypothetical protein
MAVAFLESRLPNDMVEEVSKRLHSMNMKTVLHELGKKTHDIESIFMRFVMTMPILLPVTHLNTARKIKEALPDLNVYIDAWSTWNTVIMQVSDDGRYLILHSDFEGGDRLASKFLVDVRIHRDTTGIVCTVNKQITWNDNPYCANITLKGILDDTMGFAEQNVIIMDAHATPFDRYHYIHDFMSMFLRLQFCPDKCPDFVHLLV